MTSRRETLREYITLSIAALAKPKGADLSEIEKQAAEDIVARDLEKKSKAVVQVYDKINQLEGDLRKINRADQISYDKDRKVIHETYSKGRLDEIEKVNRQISQISGNLDKAINEDNPDAWSKLYNIAGGKSDGVDKGGSEDKDEK